MKERNMIGKGLQWILFMKNKMLVVFVAVFMGSMPQFIFAYDFQSDGIYYKIKDGNNVAVTKGDTDYSGDVAIPKQIIYNGQTYNVTIIDDEAFRNCTDLTSILIPNSIISIGSFSFQNCSMTSITIPQSVSSVGEFVFTGCKRLTTINVDSDNPKFQSVSGILFDKKQTILYCYPAGKKESNYTIPDSVCSIEEGAFYYCDALTSIVIPNSVTSIGACAFEKCSGFTSITIPNGVISIGNYAFCECSELTTISIPNSVTSIGMFSFYKCSSLTTITIPKSVISIGEGSFMTCKNLTSINVDNDNPQFLSDSGVLYDKDQNSVLCFPNGKKDSKFTIPNRVKTIGKRAFGGCKNLISISIPNSVISIEGAAFEDCINLTSITIPNSVKSIEGSVWWHCPSITSIISVIKDPFEISESVFKSNYSTATLTVPKGTKSAYQSTNYWNKFSTIVESILTSEELTEIHMMKDSCVAMLKIIDQTYLDLTEGRDFVPEHKSWLDMAFNEMKSDINILQLTIDKCEHDGFDKAVSAAFDEVMNKINDENVESPLYTFRHYIQSCSFKCNEGGCINVGSITVRNETRELWFFYSKAFNNNYSIGKEFYITIVPDEGYRLIGNWDNSTINSDAAWGSFEVEFEPISSPNKWTIHVATAGTLPDLISESEKYTIEELTITGELNGTDFRLLRDMAGNSYLGENTSGKLAVLDLTNAKVVVGGEKYLDTDRIVGNGINSRGSYHYDISKSNVIPDYVFCGCYLKEIQIPNSVTSLGSSSFYYCRNLTSINIPSSVTSIRSSVFGGCSGLTSIVVESGNSVYDSRNDCNAIIRKTSNELVLGCKNTIIPNYVTRIGGGAFYGCSGLTSIIIPNSVTSIGNSAFYGCSGLTSLSIPNSVTEIGSSVFGGCSSLTSITIPNSVTSISYHAFDHCRALTTITIPNSVTNIGGGAFYFCSGLTSITIPNSVTSIGDQAFRGCSGLTSITIPSSVTSIVEGAFYDCSGLTSITIPNSVTSIGDAAFFGCSGLKDVISEIKTPFEINENVFFEIGDYFSVYSIAKLTVPKGTKSAYQSTKYWNKFINIVESTSGGDDTGSKRSIHVATAGTLPDLISSSDKYTIEELILTGELNGTDLLYLRQMAGATEKEGVSSNGGKLVVLDISEAKFVTGGGAYLWFMGKPEGDEKPDYTEPLYIHSSDMDEIPSYAFECCQNLKAVVLPKGIEIIGDYAFKDCSGLATINIPNSMTTIGNYSFQFCSSLTSITIPNSVTTLGYSAFYGCRGLTSITIPHSLMSIPRDAFAGCSSLTSITIPSSVISIGENAFTGTGWYNNQNNGVLYLDKWLLGFKGDKPTGVLFVAEGTIGIAARAFYNCSSLNSITIPNSVMNIGDYAFSWCSGLKDVISEINNPFEISENVFSVYSTAKLTIPKGTKSAYQSTSSWNKFSTIVEAEDGNVETEVTFASNGITYKGTIATQLGEVTAVGSNSKNMEIPSSVTYDGKSYSVTSIKSGALDGLSLNCLSIPSSITSLDNTIFSRCDLGALIWNANIALSSSVFSNAKFSTSSNFLLYVNSASYAPSNVKNVVVGTSANTILLSDNGGNFYCPKEFTAQTISYTHNYSMTTGGNGKGWETLALPFDVQKIEHKTKGTLTPFAKYNSADDSQRPFWLYRLDSNGFKRTDAIKANTPYIIAMPNDSKYDSEYILAGDVTFYATNTRVYQTESLEKPYSNGKMFIPAFAVVNPSLSVYALNVNNYHASYYGSYDAGSWFISNLRKVYPFEAYMTTSSSNARTLSIEFEDDATGIDEVPRRNIKGGVVKVYTLTGLLVFSAPQSEFAERWSDLPSGVYIVNGKKMIKTDDVQSNVVQ